MKKEIKLKIEYGGGLDEKLDNILEKILKDFGWRFEGSGFDFETDIRDLAFFKEFKFKKK